MICNVPDEVVESVKMGTWCGSSVAEKMIANGIPLDKIRTEIMSLDYIDEDKYEGTSISPMIYRDDVLEIIDKYKAESEGEE